MWRWSDENFQWLTNIYLSRATRIASNSLCGVGATGISNNLLTYIYPALRELQAILYVALELLEFQMTY